MAASDDQMARTSNGDRPPQMTEMRRLLGAMQRQVETIVRERELTRDMQETMARELAEGKRRGTWLTTVVGIALVIALGGILLMGAVLYHRTVTDPADPGQPAALPTETVAKTASAVSALIKPGQDRLRTEIGEIRRDIGAISNEVTGLDRSYHDLRGAIQGMDVTLGDMQTEIDGLKQTVNATSPPRPAATLQPAPAAPRLAVPGGSRSATDHPERGRPAQAQSGFDQPGFDQPGYAPPVPSPPDLAAPDLKPSLVVPARPVAAPAVRPPPPPPPKPTPPRRPTAAHPTAAPAGRPISAGAGSVPAPARHSAMQAAQEAAAAIGAGRGPVASPAAPRRPPVALDPLAYGAPALDDRRFGRNAAPMATISPPPETGFTTPVSRVAATGRAAAAEPTIHWTHNGETLNDIAGTYSVPTNQIMRANPNYGLRPGMPCPDEPLVPIEDCSLQADIRIIIPR